MGNKKQPKPSKGGKKVKPSAKGTAAHSTFSSKVKRDVKMNSDEECWACGHDRVEVAHVIAKEDHAVCTIAGRLCIILIPLASTDFFVRKSSSTSIHPRGGTRYYSAQIAMKRSTIPWTLDSSFGPRTWIFLSASNCGIGLGDAVQSLRSLSGAFRLRASTKRSEACTSACILAVPKPDRARSSRH